MKIRNVVPVSPGLSITKNDQRGWIVLRDGGHASLADDFGFPGEKVTVISQDVIDEMDHLGISDDIFDEVIYAVKGVPPGQRVAYLRQLFSDEVDHEIDD